MTCCFCKHEIFLEDAADVAACYECLDQRGLPRTGEGLIEHLDAKGWTDVPDFRDTVETPSGAL